MLVFITWIGIAGYGKPIFDWIETTTVAMVQEMVSNFKMVRSGKWLSTNEDHGNTEVCSTCRVVDDKSPAPYSVICSVKCHDDAFVILEKVFVRFILRRAQRNRIIFWSSNKEIVSNSAWSYSIGIPEIMCHCKGESRVPRKCTDYYLQTLIWLNNS